jgi:hypothetical protein
MATYTFIIGVLSSDGRYVTGTFGSETLADWLTTNGAAGYAVVSTFATPDGTVKIILQKTA